MSSESLVIDHCENCGSEAFHIKRVSETFDIDGKLCLVEKIPAMVCDRCGEELFSSETSERIRVMLHGSNKPLRSVARCICISASGLAHFVIFFRLQSTGRSLHSLQPFNLITPTRA